MYVRFGPRFNVDCAELISLYGGALAVVDIWVFILSVDVLLNVLSVMQKPAFSCFWCDVWQNWPSGFGGKLFWNYSVPNVYLYCYTCMQQKRVHDCYHVISTKAVFRIYVNSLVYENFSHCLSRCCYRMPAYLWFYAESYVEIYGSSFMPITLQRLIRTAKFLQVFVATDNSLYQLFHCSAVNLLNDILCEYNVHVHTAGQLANRLGYMTCSLQPRSDL